MSLRYRLVQWTPSKRWYGAAILAGVLLYVATFVLVGKLILREQYAISDEILLMRAFGTCAIVMLHLVLCIGPLSRLDRRFLVLLYNRRHLGVATFLVGLVHGVLAFGFYHGFGSVTPPVSLLSSNVEYGLLSAFPFELLGLVGLLILFVMAATSHDFWLKNLSPRVWKGLHMLVYFAYGLLIVHVALGAMQSERHIIYPVLLLLGVVMVTALHITAGRCEAARDSNLSLNDNWVDAGAAESIPNGRGKSICIGAAGRIAVFRYDGNACAHQGGPLGEGKIIDGCVTCPWHGYQYRPHDGCAPPPFTERVRTYPVKVENGRVWVSTNALPPNTPVEPAAMETAEPRMNDAMAQSQGCQFYVGYLRMPPMLRRFVLISICGLFLALAAVAGIVASGMRNPGDGRWALDDMAVISGRLSERPYPALHLNRDDGGSDTILLVGEGKVGMAGRIDGLDGRIVKATGHWIRRADLNVFEVLALAADGLNAVVLPEREETAPSRLNLTGEIIDPKCYAGAMKPGDGNAHKACAALCLRGGIPPVLAVPHEGRTSFYLLANAGGQPLTGEELDRVARLAGERVQIEGRVTSGNDLPTLCVEPGSLRRP